jgi:hypothetical protein
MLCIQALTTPIWECEEIAWYHDEIEKKKAEIRRLSNG